MKVDGTFKVELTEDQRSELIEYYEAKVQKLKSELNRTQLLLANLNGKADTTPIENKAGFADSNYPYEAKLGPKILYVLEKIGLCVSADELKAYLLTFEPGLGDTKNFGFKVAGTIGAYMKNKLASYMSKNVNYIGLKEWFDNGGKVKSKHAHNNENSLFPFGLK